MPITTKHGSIFDSRAQVLVCPVNCVGVMGKSFATRPTLRECQILAHDTARLWAGESE